MRVKIAAAKGEKEMEKKERKQDEEEEECQAHTPEKVQAVAHYQALRRQESIKTIQAFCPLIN
jgi:hypothetical protein